MDESGTNMPMYKQARLKTMLKSKEYTDCCFIIDGEKLEAHKVLLACSSPVFEKMLYGPLASDEIIIPDVDLNDFKQMLEFVYTDNIIIESVQNAWNLYYIANKYLLADLVAFCVAFIERNLTMDTLALSYELSEMYCETGLGKWCWQDMIFYTKGVLLCDADYHIKISTLSRLLEESISLNYSDIILGIINWAAHECNYKQIELSSSNVIDLIIEKDLAKYINKPELNKINKVQNMLVEDCLKNLADVSKTNGKGDYISCDSKESIFRSRLSYACKERQLYKIAREVSLEDGDGFYCIMESNRKVILFGMVINTEHEPFNAHSPVYDGMNVVSVVGSTESSIHAKYVGQMTYDTTQYIPFNELIVLDANQLYTIRISYTNLNLHRSSVVLHYLSHKLCYDKNNTVFTFFESCGSVVRALCYYPA